MKNKTTWLLINFLLLLVTTAYTQTRTISGKITDKNGEGLIGASVKIDGTIRGALTNQDGLFSLDNVPQTGKITVSYISYKSITLSLKANENVYNVLLQEDAQNLDDVVVTGFISQKKASVLGAIATVTTSDIKIPNSNLINALAGQAAGIITLQSRGAPGEENPTFLIRGLNTFGANQNPLKLVDGIERDINDIEPEDIESISLMKDATATALYGVRGANGVLLITTKRGSEGKMQISAKVQGGIAQLTKIPEFVNSATWATMYNEAYTNIGQPARFTADDIRKFEDGSSPYTHPNVNWFDEVFKKQADNQRMNINISGGGGVAKYFISFSGLRETGNYKTDNSLPYNTNIDYKRYNFRSNLDLNLTKTTSLEFHLSNIVEDGNRPTVTPTTLIGAAYISVPLSAPVRFEDGRFAAVAGDGGNIYTRLTQSGYQYYFNNNLNTDLTLTQNLSVITEGLSLRTRYSYDGLNNTQFNRARSVDLWNIASTNPDGTFNYVKATNGSPALAFSRASSGDRQQYLEAALMYNRTFKAHSFNGLLLYNQSDARNSFSDSYITSISRRNQGIAGRIAYDLDQKYYVELNFGYNGSENFAPGKRYGFFPSASVGWIASNEKWFKTNIINFAKLRMSHGQAGNDQIGGRRFGYITTVGTGNGSFAYGTTGNNSISGRGENEIGVSDLTWEVATKSNIGLELKFLKAFNLQADVFYEHRRNILLRRSNSTPAFTGVVNDPFANLGEMENKGIDLNFEFKKTLAKDVSLRVFGNLGYNKNKVLNRDEAFGKPEYQKQAGHALNQNYGLISLGLFKDQADIDASPKQTYGQYYPGDIKYEDYNKDGKIDDDDRVFFGNTSTPSTNYGFGTGLDYKKFSLYVLFQGAAGIDVIPNANTTGDSYGFYPFIYTGIRGQVLTDWQNRWTIDNPNPNAKYPRLSAQSTNNYRSSNFWLLNMSYLRLKSVQLGYTLPSKIFKKVGVQKARAYVDIYNWLYWSKFKNWDPQLAGNGADYPISKTINGGISLNF